MGNLSEIWQKIKLLRTWSSAILVRKFEGTKTAMAVIKRFDVMRQGNWRNRIKANGWANLGQVKYENWRTALKRTDRNNSWGKRRLDIGTCPDTREKIFLDVRFTIRIRQTHRPLYSLWMGIGEITSKRRHKIQKIPAVVVLFGGMFANFRPNVRPKKKSRGCLIMPAIMLRQRWKEG